MHDAVELFFLHVKTLDFTSILGPLTYMYKKHDGTYAFANNPSADDLKSARMVNS